MSEVNITNATEAKVYEGKELFSGRTGKYIFINYMEVEPWWYNDPTRFDKSTIIPIVSVNGTVLESDPPFYSTAAWKIKADPEGTGRQPTRHDDSNCIIYFTGSDYENIWELGAEIEFIIENEKHIIDKPCAVYIPKGVQFGPISYRKVTRPVLQFYILPDTPWYRTGLDEMHPETYTYDEPAEEYPMYGGKWGKCIITNSNRYEAAWYYTPEFDHSQYKDIVYLDAQSLPGGVTPYTSCTQWKFKAEPPNTGHPWNYHIDADEILFCVGSDWENPYELNATLEFTIDGEKHVTTRSCAFYFPRFMPHGPMWFREVSRPTSGFFLLQQPFYHSEDGQLSYNDLRKQQEAAGTEN